MTGSAGSQDLAAARLELRRLQGPGARYDSSRAPALELDWARRGTAFFARKLNELGDDELALPSALPGWTRAELIAHVGYNARALTKLTEWARTGIETPMYDSALQRTGEIRWGGTLPARALRHLFDHSAVHLNVEWRDLTDEQWDHDVLTAQGRTVAVRETAWMRAREVWIHAVDLVNGASFREFPQGLLQRLVGDVQAVWNRRGANPGVNVCLAATACQVAFEPRGTMVTGEVSDIARWMTGRGAHRLTSTSVTLPELPRWL